MNKFLWMGLLIMSVVGTSCHRQPSDGWGDATIDWFNHVRGLHLEYGDEQGVWLQPDCQLLSGEPGIELRAGRVRLLNDSMRLSVALGRAYETSQGWVEGTAIFDPTTLFSSIVGNVAYEGDYEWPYASSRLLLQNLEVYHSNAAPVNLALTDMASKQIRPVVVPRDNASCFVDIYACVGASNSLYFFRVVVTPVTPVVSKEGIVNLVDDKYTIFLDPGFVLSLNNASYVGGDGYPLIINRPIFYEKRGEW
jgi:hypothetical protein